jgi:hypothetical protein
MGTSKAKVHKEGMNCFGPNYKFPKSLKQPTLLMNDADRGLMSDDRCKEQPFL